MMRLFRQLEEAVQAIRVCKQPPALIGGLAVILHKVIRSTTDIDFLVAAEDADRLQSAVEALGYRCIFRSEHAANYERDDERLDVIYSYPGRSSAALLQNAEVRRVPLVGEIRVVSIEGLLGFKVDGYLGSGRKRTKDLDDIREILRMHRDKLDMAEVEKYFNLHPDGLALLRETLADLTLVEPSPDE